MLCRLSDLAASSVREDLRVLRGVDPGAVARLNGVGSELFAGVPGLSAYVTEDGQSGLVAVFTGRDVNISAVATRPEARRSGRATALTRAVLADARDQGLVTVSLQATPEAEQVYARLGFTPVGHWQEWLPARDERLLQR
jgi:GNAT superfamily N-acetyltransferase